MLPYADDQLERTVTVPAGTVTLERLGATAARASAAAHND